ncbi:MAG: MiaB/RimO family radical SAM methylthiotransferase [Polyangia bacterium]
MPLKVTIWTVGCRANQADSARLARYLDGAAVLLSKNEDDCDLVVINTCCVTAEAERDCRKLARRALRRYPGARVVLTGCAVSAGRDSAWKLGNRVERRGGGDVDPLELAGWINELAGGSTPAAPPRPAFFGRARPLLKVQSGCDHGCAYCIVPRARGAPRSLPPELVEEEAALFAEAGYRELVLTGVQIGAWGRDLTPKRSLAELVELAADRFAPGRVRFSSLEPWAVDERLLEVVGGHPRICPHLHLPLQSGDDEVLALMRRGYRGGDFVRLVEAARRNVDGLALGTDVLLGFPGESAGALQHTLEVLETVRPAYVHAFPYSPRPDTPAAGLDAPTPSRGEARRRVRVVRELSDRLGREFRAGLIGTRREILVEQSDERGASGLSEDYVRVAVHCASATPGELLAARLEQGWERDRISAVVIERENAP